MKSNFLLAALGSFSLISNVYANSASESFDVVTQELDHISDLTNNLTKSIKAWDGKDLEAALNNIHCSCQLDCCLCRQCHSSFEKVSRYLRRHPGFQDWHPGSEACLCRQRIHRSHRRQEARF